MVCFDSAGNNCPRVYKVGRKKKSDISNPDLCFWTKYGVLAIDNLKDLFI